MKFVSLAKPSAADPVPWSQEHNPHLAPGKRLENISSSSVWMLPEAGGEMGSPGTTILVFSQC